MSNTRRFPNPDALARAQVTIADQAAELDHLRQRLRDAHVAEELLAALSAAAAAGTIASPLTPARVLEMIVETAADVIGSHSGALFLLDEATNELTFEVALGPKSAEVKRGAIIGSVSSKCQASDRWHVNAS